MDNKIFKNTRKILCVVLSLAMVFSMFIVFSAKVFAAGGKTIDVIEIDYVTTPKTGRTIEDGYVLKTEGLYVVNVQWEPQDTTEYKPLTQYEVMLNLETKPMYEISNSVKVYINGQEAQILSKGADNIKVALVFPKTEKYDVPDISYYVDYTPYRRFYLEKGESLEINVNQMSSVEESKLKYQWYSAKYDLRGIGSPIEGANEITYKVTASDIGDTYYFCVVSYEVDGQVVNTFDSDKDMVKISVIDKSKFYLKPVTDLNFVTYSTEEDFAFEVSPVNASGDVTYSWYQCDAYGNTIDNTKYSDGQAMLMFGLRQEDMMNVLYYKCVAKSGKEEAELVFSCVLYPMGVESEPVAFDDVPEDSWYYSYVDNAVNMNLINGKSETRFDPLGNLTYAEAIKLAACMNQLYNNNEVTLKNGTPWYQTYLDYAKKNGIPYDYKDYNAKITREDFVHIFYAALPKEEYKKINNIDAIPDIAGCPYINEIKTLYNAGIITGKDNIGSFYPKDNIKRKEVAAIICRMMDFDLRQKFTPDPFGVE